MRKWEMPYHPGITGRGIVLTFGTVVTVRRLVETVETEWLLPSKIVV